MKKVIALFPPLPLGWSINVWSFSCKSIGCAVIPCGRGSANVYTQMSPFVAVGKNLVVYLSRQIFCKNESYKYIKDYVSLKDGSRFGTLLDQFKSTLKYKGNTFQFPIITATSNVLYDSKFATPWSVSSVSGVAMMSGDLIATLIQHLTNDRGYSAEYTSNIYSNNDVVVPTGGCDVSARDITVTQPDYPGTMAMPVTVYSGQNQNLENYLSGNTIDSANSIFTNTASALPAQDIGVQMIRNGTVVPANSNVSLGMVGTSQVNLDLTTIFARTGDQVTAGNVQPILGGTFAYQ